MPDETFKGNIAEAIEAGKVIGSMQEAFYAGDDLGDIPIVAEAKHIEVKVLHDLIATRDSRAERPRAILGCAKLTTLASFVEHVNRFKDAKSTLWADIDAVNVRAFYDYHEGPMLPRWGRHHSIYSSPRSAEWQEWMGNDETSMTQDAFGVWIDDHMRDLASVPGYPEPAAVLEMARNLVIHSKGIFERKINPTTGEGVLIVKDEHEPTSTKIIKSFMLQLPVFEAGAMYAVEARIRFSLNNGRPVFAYDLFRPDRILRDAFDEVVKAAKEQTGLPVFYGTRES